MKGLVKVDGPRGVRGGLLSADTGLHVYLLTESGWRLGCRVDPNLVGRDIWLTDWISSGPIRIDGSVSLDQLLLIAHHVERLRGVIP